MLVVFSTEMLRCVCLLLLYSSGALRLEADKTDQEYIKITGGYDLIVLDLYGASVLKSPLTKTWNNSERFLSRHKNERLFMT
jgi:hypothetical protein